MGQVLPLPRRRLPPARVLPVVADRTFLPAALSIVETPPSPVRMGLLVTICALTTLGLAWAWFSEIDIHAVARGKVEAAGHTKVVQPMETGRVAEIRVVDGQAVRAGDVLLVLDGREIEAELAAATHAWTATAAEALRRSAALAAVRGGMVAPPAIDWPAEIPMATRAREEAVLHGDLDELASSQANLEAQVHEKEAAIRQSEMSMEVQRVLLQREGERVSLRQVLAKEGNGSQLTLIDAQQSMLETRAQMAGEMGREMQARASVETLETERHRQVQAFLADNQRKLADARRTADEKGQEAAKARVRLDRSTLRSPVNGTVEGLGITNAGQVVTPSQEVMRVVPSGMPMEILAYVTNDDIGFVAMGQRAVVKLDAFPFTRFGTIEAEVMEVAADAVTTESAGAQQGDATKAVGREGTGLTPQSRPVADLVFAARLRPGAQGLLVNGREVALVPGMTVSVEVKTGRRRVLEYLFSPIVDVVSGAGRER